MHIIDWIVVVLPVSLVLAISVYSKRYVRGVVDFLAAGRVAGRYVISVADMAAAMSVMTLVALIEAKYQVGFALTYWEFLTIPIGLSMSLTGFCI